MSLLEECIASLKEKVRGSFDGLPTEAKAKVQVAFSRIEVLSRQIEGMPEVLRQPLSSRVAEQLRRFRCFPESPKTVYEAMIALPETIDHKIKDYPVVRFSSAAFQNRSEDIHALIAAGCDIDTPDSVGWNALRYELSRIPSVSFDALRVLIECGATVTPALIEAAETPAIQAFLEAAYLRQQTKTTTVPARIRRTL